MKSLFKSSSLAVGAYVILTMLLYFLMLTPKTLDQKPYLFFQDFSLDYRIHSAIIEDHNGNRAFITRAFYNKATFLLGNIFTSFTRASDPVFIFDLTPPTNLNYDNYYPSPLPFWEFPLFLLASIVLIKEWEKRQKQLKYLLLLLCLSLFFASLFLSNFTLKYLPLVLIIELITAVGLESLFVSIKKLCLKK
jgi:hypothetical protein